MSTGPRALGAAALASVLLLPVTAYAGTTIGSLPFSAGGCDGPSDLFQTARPDGIPVAAPTAGVLTSWSFLASTSLGSSVTLRVFRATPSPNVFTVVADAGPLQTVPADGGVHVFPTRVPVRAGDHIGLHQASGVCGNITSSTYEFRSLIADVPVGSPAAYPPGEGYVVDLAATLEPDADGDDFGDETQDACPASALTQQACPAPDTAVTKKPKPGKRKSKLRFSSSLPGSTFACSLDGRPAKACASPARYTCLSPGKHFFSVAARSAFGIVDPTPTATKFRVSPKRKGC